jgi:dimethylargininase
MEPVTPQRRTRALTREIPASLAQCELSFLEREPIDGARAVAQHHAYCETLAALGLDVVRLPADPALPDSCFVEDAAVVVDEIAVIASMGAPSRRAETPAVEYALAADRPIARIALPARLDGGDVLVVGRRVFVGRSGRTDAAGAAALAAALAPFGYQVLPVAVTGCLHLKSAVTALDTRTLLVNPEWIDAAPLAGYDLVSVDPAEPSAANALAVAGRILAHGGFPRTLARVEARGFPVIRVDVSEFLKAEAGVTCKSILYTDVGRSPTGGWDQEGEK